MSKPERVAAWRLAHGAGDIVEAYSGDRIAEDRPLRRPFVWKGELYTAVSTGPGPRAVGYRLVPRQALLGATRSYRERADAGGLAARLDPYGFYDRVRARHNGRAFVLLGPPVQFEAAGDGDATFAAEPGEYAARLAAERLAAALALKSERPLDRGRAPMTDAPLFGGPRQASLFEPSGYEDS